MGIYLFIIYKKEIGIIIIVIMIKLEIRKIQSRKTMLSPLWESTKNWEIMLDLFCFACCVSFFNSTHCLQPLLLFFYFCSWTTLRNKRLPRHITRVVYTFLLLFYYIFWSLSKKKLFYF